MTCQDQALARERLTYQWLAGYDKDDEPDLPAQVRDADSQVDEGDGDEADECTIFDRFDPEAHSITSDTFYDAEEMR